MLYYVSGWLFRHTLKTKTLQKWRLLLCSESFCQGELPKLTGAQCFDGVYDSRCGWQRSTDGAAGAWRQQYELMPDRLPVRMYRFKDCLWLEVVLAESAVAEDCAAGSIWFQGVFHAEPFTSSLLGFSFFPGDLPERFQEQASVVEAGR